MLGLSWAALGSSVVATGAYEEKLKKLKKEALSGCAMAMEREVVRGEVRLDMRLGEGKRRRRQD
jgi:hypothetical protein